MDTFPKCIHLEQFPQHEATGICSLSSKMVGSAVEVAPVLCKTMCKRSGPYCGRELNHDEKQGWTASLIRLQYTYVTQFRFAQKIIKKFSSKTYIDYPDKILNLRNAFQPILQDDLVKQICLGGSSIVRGRPIKDWDIVLVVEDIPGFIERMTHYKAMNVLPDRVAGIPVDLKITLHPSGFFGCLDLYEKTFYRSFEFNKCELADGIREMTTELYGPYDENLATILTRMQPMLTKTDTPEYYEWNKRERAGLGELIAKMTKAFGVKPCSACEARRKKWNRLTPPWLKWVAQDHG